ncbi:MFS transporter [Nonomuraea pusilla]|uniref:MFS transporter n=1 Tax=Nonomuraea pusilla TaxID=46177 RepID=UPI0033169FAE
MPDSPSLLASRSFVLLAAARLVSALGSAVAPVALAFALVEAGRPAADVGVVLGARAAAVVVALPLAGVVAHRYPVRAVLVGAALLAAAAQAAAAALVLAGHAEPWPLALSQAVGGIAAALHVPAAGSALPGTVPSELLPHANAVVRLGANAALIGGSAAGGVMVAAAGPGWSIAADAASFLLAAALCTGMRPSPRHGRRASGAASPGLARELAEGWQDVRSRTWLWACVLQCAVVNAAVAAGIEVLGPVAAHRLLGGAAAWGAVLAAQSAGLLVGGLVAVRLRTARPLRDGVAALLLVAPLPALLAAAAPLPVLVVAALPAGAGLEVFAVHWNTVMQRHVPADRLSRVYAYDGLGSNAAVPLGAALAGPVESVVGLSGALLGSAFAIVVPTAAVLASRAVRGLPASP